MAYVIPKTRTQKHKKKHNTRSHTDWYFNQDGSIGHEIKLTGILSTSLLTPKEAQRTAAGGGGAAGSSSSGGDAATGGGGHGAGSRFGTMVAEGVNAAAHQVC